VTDVSEPGAADGGFARLLCASHAQIVGRPLLEPRDDEAFDELARRLYRAPFALLAHDAGVDPQFIYANLAAQRLFERTWAEMVGLPSRLSAETPAQEERERLLRQVAERGYVDDYAGVRIAKSGRRFRIERATVWNLVDDDGRRLGQAASFTAWEPCP
jgi:hypothetical protein